MKDKWKGNTKNKYNVVILTTNSQHKKEEKKSDNNNLEGEEERDGTAQSKEIRHYQKMDCLIYETFYTNHMVTTKQITRIKIQITNEKKANIEIYLPELVVQKSRDRKQRKCKRTRKQVIKWQHYGPTFQ